MEKQPLVVTQPSKMGDPIPTQSEIAAFTAVWNEQLLGGALLSRAYNNDLQTVEILIKNYGAPVNFTDPQNGLSALHIAVGRDYLEMAKYLVECGAAFAADDQGRTPSTIAAECEVSDEMCDFIVEAEAEADGV
jgi:ankyrin repeat protein